MTLSLEPQTAYHFDDHAQSMAKRQYMFESDKDVFGMFRRVADWVASGENSSELRAKWGATFYDLMASKRFCPGGRVLAGAGTQHGNVLNCFVQGATDNPASSFEGVMEVAKKLALVTKVGGGNGVNLDVYPPRAASSRRDAGVRGWAYMSANHADVEDFIKGLMRPPTQPDGAKQPTTVRNWTKAIYGVVSPAISSLARQYGVTIVPELPEGVEVIRDDMGGIIDAARIVAEQAKMNLEPRIDLTGLRAEGAEIKGSGGSSSGPVSFLFEIFDNFLEWANLGAETSGPVNTLRYCYAPVLRVVRQGGCLHPDTLVHTSRGTLRLRELVDAYQFGHQLHQLQVATDQGWKDSLEGFNNGIANTLKITLENGFELQGTPNHKLKVMRENGKREWLRFDELQANDFVIQVLDQHTGSTVQLEPLAEQHFNATAITTPETLTEDLAFFLGYFWGDGFISTGGRIGLCASHESIMMQRAPAMFQELFGLNVSLQQKPNDKSAVFVVKSAALTNWLRQNGLLKTKAQNLELPRAIRQAPRHVLAAFLRGLFEADGGVTEHYPYLSSASKQLVQDVAVMLGGLGIPTRIATYAPREDRYSQNEHYRLRVETSLGLKNFLERINYIEGSRFEVLKNFTPDDTRASSWELPHASALLEPVFNNLPAGRKNSPSEFTQTRKTLSRYIRGERQLTMTGMARLAQNTQIAEMLPEVSHEEYFVPIKSIEAGGRILTLDISVNENHTYLANGMVSHNTRRGAGMATISIDHADVLDFLTAKDLDRESSEGDISTFNISILATEKFIQTLEKDGLWNISPLEVNAKYHIVKLEGEYTGKIPTLETRVLDGAKGVPLYAGGIPARWLWREIATHAWSTGEPGLIFNDRINELSALKNLGERYQIKSTNPCLTADTMIAVADGRGAVSIGQLTLEGRDVPVYTMDNNGQPTVRYLRNPRVTGYAQKVYTVTFDDGLKVRVTGNHKFNLTNGTSKPALELQPGDSVAALTRFHGNFEHALKLPNTSTKDYAWLTSGKGQPVSEHRLIARFQIGRKLTTGEVVHHRDHNGLNNHPENLEVMTREAHEALHRDGMIGDKNPMRDRWWAQLSEARKDAYRKRMSSSTSAERNGRYSGVTHEAILEAARVLAQQLGRGFTRTEWHEYAGQNNLPQSLSAFRREEFGNIQELSNRVALELGVQAVPRGVGHSRHFASNQELFQIALESGFVNVRHEGDFYPIVTRACEDCGTHYEQPWNKREISYCRPCGLKQASAKGKEGARAAMKQISENTAEQQIRAFNDLKFSLNRRPYKAEWEDHCKAFGIPVRLHPGAIPTYKDLEQRASVANHRVISVEYAGIEDVYNGTVDEFHNYYIGHHDISGNKPRFSYVNTRNCGEIPLTVGEPCDLGAINLAAYVEKGTFNFKKFRSDVRDCTRFLDDVLEVNKFALEDNRIASQDLRRLGLGVMGLADALILMGLRYDRQDGRDMIDQIMNTMREEAVRESENLGLERGVYPVFERYQDKIPHAPRRNVAVLTVAPTGTTSMLMGVSSGIEPVFSPFIWRKIGSDYKALIAPLFQELLEQFPAHPQYARDGRWDWDKVTEALGGNHGSCVGLDFVPQVVQDVFVCAHDIAPLDHVRMQGTVQKAFDREGYAANSLSKTINLPNSATVEEIEAAYLEAYKTGCKGITVYRDGSRQFQVLSVSKDEKKEEAKAETPKLEIAPELTESSDNHTWQASPKFQPGKPILERPTRLTGVTDMVKLTDLGAGSKRTFLITTNTLEGKPMEVVVVSGRAGDEANADSEALGRVVSIALQYGVPAEAIQKTLRGINGGLYGSYNGRLVASKADLIAVALESTSSTGGVKPAEQPLLYPILEGAAPESSSDTPLFKIAQAVGAHTSVAVEMKGEKCPSCSSPNLVREEGCLKCQSCGYSKCG